MSELSEAECDELARMLSTMDDAQVNLIALDKKYGKEWYERQLQTLREQDEYFKEVGKVLHIAGQSEAEKAIDNKREHIARIMAVYEDAIENLEQKGSYIVRREE